MLLKGNSLLKWREQNKDKLETVDQLLEQIKRERDVEYQSKLDAWKTALKEGRDIAKPRKPKELRSFSEEGFRGFLIYQMSGYGSGLDG